MLSRTQRKENQCLGIARHLARPLHRRCHTRVVFELLNVETRLLSRVRRCLLGLQAYRGSAALLELRVHSANHAPLAWRLALCAYAPMKARILMPEDVISRRYPSGAWRWWKQLKKAARGLCDGLGTETSC